MIRSMMKRLQLVLTTRNRLCGSVSCMHLGTSWNHPNLCVFSSRMIVRSACSCVVGGSTRALSGSLALFTLEPEAGKDVMTGPGELILCYKERKGSDE